MPPNDTIETWFRLRLQNYLSIFPQHTISAVHEQQLGRRSIAVGTLPR